MTVQPAFALSRNFQDKADAAALLSYRLVHMEFTFHLPDFPHLVQTFSYQLYDRLETGLGDLILARAALENPSLAPQLVRFFDDTMPPQPAKNRLGAIKTQILNQFRLSADYPQGDILLSAEDVAALRAQTDLALDDRLTFLHNFPEGFRLCFDTGTDMANIVQMEQAPETHYLTRVRNALVNWLVKPVHDRLAHETDPRPLQAIAPLKFVDINLRRVAAWKEFDAARQAVESATARGRILHMAPGEPKIILH